MVNVEEMNMKFQGPHPMNDFKSTAGAFASDLLELAELQAKLIRSDTKSAVRQSVGSAAAFVIACSFLLGSLPVAILGLASAAAYYLEVELWVTQLAIGGSLSFISVAVAIAVVRNLSRLSIQFKRSSEEFSKTFQWTKSVFDRNASR